MPSCYCYLFPFAVFLLLLMDSSDCFDNRYDSECHDTADRNKEDP